MNEFHTCTKFKFRRLKKLYYFVNNTLWFELILSKFLNIISEFI